MEFPGTYKPVKGGSPTTSSTSSHYFDTFEPVSVTIIEGIIDTRMKQIQDFYERRIVHLESVVANHCFETEARILKQVDLRNQEWMKSAKHRSRPGSDILEAPLKVSETSESKKSEKFDFERSFLTGDKMSGSSSDVGELGDKSSPRPQRYSSGLSDVFELINQQIQKQGIRLENDILSKMRTVSQELYKVNDQLSKQDVKLRGFKEWQERVISSKVRRHSAVHLTQTDLDTKGQVHKLDSEDASVDSSTAMEDPEEPEPDEKQGIKQTDETPLEEQVKSLTGQLDLLNEKFEAIDSKWKLLARYQSRTDRQLIDNDLEVKIAARQETLVDAIKNNNEYNKQLINLLLKEHSHVLRQQIDAKNKEINELRNDYIMLYELLEARDSNKSLLSQTQGRSKGLKEELAREKRSVRHRERFLNLVPDDTTESSLLDAYDPGDMDALLTPLRQEVMEHRKQAEDEATIHEDSTSKKLHDDRLNDYLDHLNETLNSNKFAAKNILSPAARIQQQPPTDKHLDLVDLYAAAPSGESRAQPPGAKMFTTISYNQLKLNNPTSPPRADIKQPSSSLRSMKTILRKSFTKK